MRELANCAPGRGVASVPGTCGELAQGMLDGTLVMVTCPIDLFATATVELSEGAGRVRGPAGSPKATRAVELLLARPGRNDVEARLHLESPLPRGKGMASSTADIVAAVGATAAALNTETTVRQQANLALAIEPSDGVMLPGIALFDHRYGRIAQSLGGPPGMRVLVLEFADALDTEAFNAVNRESELQLREAHFREALDLITAGLKNGDDEMIGRGATQNTVAYQEVLPKPQLPAVLALGRAAGAVGVNVAHSGTVLGLLFPEDSERADWAAEEAWKRLRNLTAVHNRRLIGGGIVPRHRRES